MVRFENYSETDTLGNALPYLDGIVRLPKKQDRARLLALKNGEVDLIDHLGYGDVSQFRRQFGKKLQTWDVPQVATARAGFNLKAGPFSYQNPDGQALRAAAAHAINREAIHQSVFMAWALSQKASMDPIAPGTCRV
jgi:peptide/nickel transport system substrate-binding protein